MNVTSINKQALAQTYYILEELSENIKIKIPNSLINTIKDNLDEQYTNTEELLEETKEILYAILNKYVLNESQKEKLAEYYRFYDRKIEEEKSKKYKSEVLFKNNVKQIKQTHDDQNIFLVPYKDNIVIKFLNKIKRIFKRDNNNFK